MAPSSAQVRSISRRPLNEPTQLDVLAAVDEEQGLDPWIDLLPCPPWAEA